MSQPLPLSTYPLVTLLQKWRNEELTVEQMLGQRSTDRSRQSLLQHQITQESQTLALQKEVQRLQQMMQPLR